jgi:hypothetical protein
VYTETLTKTFKNPPEVRRAMAFAMKAYREERKKQMLAEEASLQGHSPANDNSDALCGHRSLSP